MNIYEDFETDPMDTLCNLLEDLTTEKSLLEEINDSIDEMNEEELCDGLENLNVKK